ncbi:hypothetical protein [Jiella marina]|uniref:hypothetical protein n=1 Tax=Jiella sp. LLJ827 TaxID=2917712 RepID=UPI0021017AF6|nr:hypothetical protein [Jiella sp. LLJ827]MCQ0986394.1 hypothetical protein [Jiella sp. LLJ827]
MTVVPAGSWVTTEGGARVARLAKPLRFMTVIRSQLFCDWRIPPIVNGEWIDPIGPDGTPWIANKPNARGHEASTLHIENRGWVAL